MGNIQTLITKKYTFTLGGIEFSVKWLAKEKVKDIQGYQIEILKIEGLVLTHRLRKLLNIVPQQGFPKQWTQIFFLIFKNVHKRPLKLYDRWFNHFLTK